MRRQNKKGNAVVMDNLYGLLMRKRKQMRPSSENERSLVFADPCPHGRPKQSQYLLNGNIAKGKPSRRVLELIGNVFLTLVTEESVR